MANLNCPIPNNINPLSPTGFQLSITKLPDVTFFCQEANIPSISLPEIDFRTPLSTIRIPGEVLTYGDLDISFMVDEGMKNYMGIYNWLVGLGHPESFQQYTDFLANQTSPAVTELGKNFSDGTLQILGGSNTQVQSIQFNSLIPVDLGSLVFHSDVDDINYLIGKATFKFTTFNFI
jgi:hypothetical protein